MTPPTTATTIRRLERALSEPTLSERERELLVSRAAAEGLLDAAYTAIDSPWGPLLLVATDEGLVRVAFEVEDHAAVLEALTATLGGRLVESARTLEEVATQMGAYFDGSRTSFDLAVDLRLAKGFRRIALEELRRVPYGATTTYSALATSSGSPRGVRAIGTACATNPVPIVVPCHRVVRSDGTTGSYRGGHEAKVALLAMEAGGPAVRQASRPPRAARRARTR